MSPGLCWLVLSWKGLLKRVMFDNFVWRIIVSAYIGFSCQHLARKNLSIHTDLSCLLHKVAYYSMLTRPSEITGSVFLKLHITLNPALSYSSFNDTSMDSPYGGCACMCVFFFLCSYKNGALPPPVTTAATASLLFLRISSLLIHNVSSCYCVWSHPSYCSAFLFRFHSLDCNF